MTDEHDDSELLQEGSLTEEPPSLLPQQPPTEYSSLPGSRPGSKLTKIVEEEAEDG